MQDEERIGKMRKMEKRGPEAPGWFSHRSVGDGLRGAGIDAGAAVDALVGVDDSNILDGDGPVRASVGAGTARDTAVSVDFCSHL